MKDMYSALNKLPVFRLFRNTLRILSGLSLILNFIILAIYSNFSFLNWIPAIPALSQGMLFAYESTPETTQNFISWIAIKIKTFFYWIWYGLLDIIKRIIKAVMGEIENNPVHKPDIPTINPDKDKYGDINNPGYLQGLANKLNEYKFYLLSSFLIIIFGGLIYLYWDSIAGCWRRPDDSDPDTPGPLPDYNPIASDRPRSLPSVSSDSTNSLSEFFRYNITDRLLRFKNKTKSFFSRKVKPSELPSNIPLGLYQVNGKDMYNGLPLPRVETLPDGTEYYFSKGSEGFIEVLNNTFNGSGTVDIVSPFTNKSISSHSISVNERISLINKARNSAIFEAPENSFSRNPLYDFGFMGISRPDLSGTSASSSSSLPGGLDNFEDIPLSPAAADPTEILKNILKSAKGKAKETSIPENINPETGAFRSGSTTPTQPDFTADVTNPFE